MNFLGLMVVVQVVSGATSTGVEVHNMGLSPIEDCRRQVRTSSELPQVEKFTRDGKLILSQEYQCVLIAESDVVQVMQRLEESKASQATFEKPLNERVDRMPAN